MDCSFLRLISAQKSMRVCDGGRGDCHDVQKYSSLPIDGTLLLNCLSSLFKACADKGPSTVVQLVQMLNPVSWEAGRRVYFSFLRSMSALKSVCGREYCSDVQQYSSLPVWGTFPLNCLPQSFQSLRGQRASYGFSSLYKSMMYH